MKLPGLCALCVVFLFPLARPVQAQQVSDSFAQGTHLFRRILHDLNLRPLRDLDELFKEPADKLLIVLGETEYLETRDLADFVHQGGALLLATDRDCEDVLKPFRVRIVGDVVNARHAAHAYKSDDCIFVQPGGKDSPLFENLSVEKNLSRVATNRPGYLNPAMDCKLQRWATFPPGCYALRERYRKKILPFAMGGDWGQGRVLILSDHSVFINAMMWQPDIENFDFAYNCVNWLTQGEKRKEVLFLEEGKIQETFEIPLREPSPPPLPPLKAIVEAVDKGLGELESDNVFNRAIHNVVAELTSPPEKWLRSVILISTALLGLFALARLSQARYRQEKAVPLAVSALARIPAGSLLEQRYQAMEREGNFWEAARALARQGVESVLGPQWQANQQSSEAAAIGPPPLKVSGRWWRKWRVRRRFNRLWQLAYGTEPIRISFRQLKRLRSEIDNMKAVLEHYNTQTQRRGSS